MVDHRLPSEWEPYRGLPALELTATGQVRVLPIVGEGYHSNVAGWCTSGWLLLGSPEVEVMCGGINTKTPMHAGIWRQGNLLHFGFEPAPSELNEQGRALLANSIAYISRFTEDRPLTRTKSVFADEAYPRSAHMLDQVVSTSASLPGRWHENFINPALDVGRMKHDEFKTWYAENRPYMYAGDRGLIDVDLDAKRMGASISKIEFLADTIDALDGSSRKQESALALLNRYVAAPPEEAGSQKAWAGWLRENRDYLFFNEASGYKWHIDTLAKQRGIPSESLHGPARATFPPPGYLDR